MSSLNDWEQSTLGELSVIAIGGTPSRSVPSYWAENDGFPWVAISDLQKRIVSETKEKISAAGVKNSNVKLVPEETVLMSFKLSLGRVAFAGCDLYTNEAIASFDCSETLDRKFLYYILPDIVRFTATDTAVKGATLNKSSLSALVIRYPSDVLVQQKIATILTTIDTAIEKTEALIEKYQKIKSGLMHDLFTRGVLPNGQLRPSFEQAPELYQETVLGWIPKEWLQNQLRTFVRSAQYGISTSLSDSEIGIPVLRMNNIQSNMFDVSDLKYTNMDDAYKIKLKRGDVLYNRTNSMEHVGKTAIWRDELPSCSFASYLVRINLHENSLLPEYFSYWMSQENSQNALRRYATPAVQQVNINPTNLQKIMISCPASIDEQLLIVGRIDSVERKLNTEKKHLEKLKSKKFGLMQDLLTGKVSVTVDQLADASNGRESHE